MGSDICLNEKLSFLHYLNENYLIYSIIILTFASLYGLVWILRKYTHFEKLKPRLIKASLPKFPYGNFTDVIKQNTSLHVLLWKYYNRFKKKNVKYGGVFVFMKPAVVIVDQFDQNQFEAVIPPKSCLKSEDVDVILHPEVLRQFVKKYNNSVRQELPETLLNGDVATTFKNLLLEASCAAFGFKPYEMIEEINQLLKKRYETNLRFYLALCLPFVGNQHQQLHNNLQDILMEIVEYRKKTESDDNDLIESFISLYNRTNYSIADISNELFSCFADSLTFSYPVLMFCLYELAGSKEVQEELKGEIRRFNRKNPQVSYENLQELVYVEAVVKETLRKYPPVATIVTRNNETPFEWYQVKKGLFFQSTLAAQRDPDFHTKPEDFDPDRFTEARKEEEIFRPFGQGPTADLCFKLVTLQVKLILISIFSGLEVRMKNGAPNFFKFNPTVWYLSPSEDFQVEFVRIT